MRHSALKHAATIKVSNVDKKSVDGELPVQVINYTDVYYGNRLGPAPELKRATATAQQLADFRLRTGDVLITKDSESADDIGVAAYVEGAAPDLVCGYHLAMLRPQSETNGRFLFWAVSSLSTQRQFETSATGVTRYGLRSDAIGGTTIPLPPLAEQRAIADYLDVETARIDALIAKKQQLIHLLEERLWSSVASSPELGGVRRVPLRRALQSIVDGPFGSALTSAHYVDAPGTRVVRLGNIGLANFKNADAAFIPSSYGQQLLRHAVEPGSLLIAGLGDSKNHVGRAVVAPDLGGAIVKADCYCAEIDKRVASAEFLAILLSSPLGRTAVAGASRGTTRSRINLDIAREIELPVPGLDAQNRLARSFEERRQQSDHARGALTRQIALLTERRQALITAAVTGELTVPGAP